MGLCKRIAVYPVFADTLPVVRYIKEYRNDIAIIELISPKGSGVCGKDASVLDNREHMGFVVKSLDETEPNAWDELYLLRHEALGITQHDLEITLNKPMKEIAQLANKHIITPVEKPQKARNETETRYTLKAFGGFNQIKEYSILVGGVVGEAGSLEVFLRMYGELSKKLKVAAFSTSANASFCGITSLFYILNSKEMTAAEKVYAISREIYSEFKSSKADIVMVHVNEALMPYSSSQTNGFGIIPYMISQVIIPDYSICCLPYDFADTEIINSFAEGLCERLGFSPDIWHISNSVLDSSVATEIQDAYAIHVPISEVVERISALHKKSESICVLTEAECLAKCVASVIEDYGINRQIDVVN